MNMNYEVYNDELDRVFKKNAFIQNEEIVEK